MSSNMYYPYPRHYFTVHLMPNDALKQKQLLLQYLALAPRNSPLNGSLEIATSHHHLPGEELGTRNFKDQEQRLVGKGGGQLNLE